MIEFDRVTTRGGDRGESSLIGGERLVKHDLIFEALGDVDELSSFLGLARSRIGTGRPEREIRTIQEHLITLGGLIATPSRETARSRLPLISAADVEGLERQEKYYLEHTVIPQRFVLPGESEPAARIDVARSVCRRAERRVVACIRDRGSTHLVTSQNYLNRLSDYLFVLARWIEQHPDAAAET